MGRIHSTIWMTRAEVAETLDLPESDILLLGEEGWIEEKESPITGQPHYSAASVLAYKSFKEDPPYTLYKRVFELEEKVSYLLTKDGNYLERDRAETSEMLKKNHPELFGV